MGLTKEQRYCVETLDRPLVVAAGAGSGKTHTLTERIVGAFECGFVSDIDEVCAITFTSKAAGELRSRVKSKLRASGFVDQALKVDEAWISTIHGMCSRILRAHAIELGLDPAFTVADESRVQGYLARSVDEVLIEARSGDLAPCLDALFAEFAPRSQGRYGSSVAKMLGALVGEASGHVLGSGVFVMPGTTTSPHSALARVVEVFEELMIGAEGEKPGKSRDTWMADTPDRLEAARTALDEGIDDCLRALELMAALSFPSRFGSAEFSRKAAEARIEVNSLIAEMRLAAARPHLDLLVELATRALEVFKREKLADGVLDNNDLLVLASRAIEDHPAIAACYTGKFKLVMIDEFQDTDQLQIDMVKRISGQGADRLCTVGDAQQSIYRFRGADVSVYRRHLESVRSTCGDSVVRLTKNFRSHKDVLAFVDRVFGQPSMFGREFMSLEAAREEGRVSYPFDDAVPRVVVQHTRADGCGIDVARTVAARCIAEQFATYREAGHSAGEMVVLLGSMANADLYAQALRDAGMSCVLTGGSVFAGSAEALVVRMLVRALANSEDTQALLDVLTSPLFRLSAGDLLAAGGLEGFPRMAAADCPDGASPQLQCALEVMGRAWKAVGSDSVAHIVGRVVSESGWLTRLQSDGAEGLARAGNVFKAIRMIEEVERSGSFGPLSVMRQFDEVLDASKEAPGALSVSEGDSVRIMTVHASKGLEFPIVAVAEMRDRRPSSSGLSIATIGGKVYVTLEGGNTADSLVKLKGAEKAALAAHVLGDASDEDECAEAVVKGEGALRRWLAINRYSAIGDEEEANRLLYVALTRAKEALVVSMTAKSSKSANPLGIPANAFRGVYEALDDGGAGFGVGVTMCDYGGSLPAVFECVALDGESYANEPPFPSADGDEVLAVPAAPHEPLAVEWEAYRPDREDVFSYSSIAAARKPDDGTAGVRSVRPDLEDGAFDFDVSRAYDEDRATRLGTAFHRLAQYAVVARSEGSLLSMPPEDRIKAVSRACGLDGEQRLRLVRALEQWFESDLAHDMAALPSLSAEVPFFVPVGDAFLEGEIDLLGFDGSGAHAYLVDYKTGGSADEASDELERKHELQAACYAYAVLRQGARRVDASFVRVEQGCECVHYRFTADQAIELPIA